MEDKMTHGSLFTGIGGFDLASEWCGWQNVFQVEIDPFCQKVLQKQFPDVMKYEDIKKFNGKEYREAIDVLSGGFPCQPFSVAGKRRGKEDDRYLWPEMLRVIQNVQSRWVVAENVPGIIGMVLGQVLSDLESEGYYNYVSKSRKKRIAPLIIPACAVNAPHRRDRVWIIAHTYSFGCNRRKSKKYTNEKREFFKNKQKRETMGSEIKRCNRNRIITNIISNGLQRNITEAQTQRHVDGCDEIAGWENDTSESPICRVVDGIPNRVDRIKALGNAIVPQIAYEIFKIIEQFNETRT